MRDVQQEEREGGLRQHNRSIALKHRPAPVMPSRLRSRADDGGRVAGARVHDDHRRSYKQDLNGCAVNFILIQKRTCRIYRIL